MDSWLLAAVLFLGLVAFLGFFRTKVQGFGRFNTSILIVLLVVTLASVLNAGGKLEGGALAQLFFAALGFAGGLLAGKES